MRSLFLCACVALGCSSGSSGGGGLLSCGDGGTCPQGMTCDRGYCAQGGSGGAPAGGAGGGGSGGTAANGGSGGMAANGGSAGAGATGGGMGATVSGQISCVNATSDATTVILADAASFDAAAVHSVAPSGPRADGVTCQNGEYTISNVPPGDYVVLAAFENDGLVVDPEAELTFLTVAGGDTSVGAIPVTDALELVGPDGGQTVSPPVSFSWVDQSSEASYRVELYEEPGNLIWESTLPGSSAPQVDVAYTGPALASGTLYQARVAAISGTGAVITKSEDLRGTFRVQ